MRFVLAIVIASVAVLATAETVTLAVGDWEPFTSSTDPESQTAQSIVIEAFATQGVTVEFEYVPWKRAYIETLEGKVDGTLPWYPSEQEKQEVIIAEEPLLEEEEVFFYRVDKDFDWTNVADLKKYNVGGTIGYVHVEVLESAGVELDKAKDDITNIKKLVSGRIDTFPISINVGKYLIKKNLSASVAASLLHHPKALSSGQMFVLFTKSDRGRRLADSFNEGIGVLRASGRYDELMR